MAGQDRGGNEGFSGTPLWKIQQQMAQYRNQVAAASIEGEDKDLFFPPEPPHVIVDTVSMGGPADGKNKFVRSVLVKDLHKIASRLKIELPATNVFKDQAPCGLYALFDGQSCAGEPGVRATEFCARNFHMKVLDNLSKLPPNQANETFVKAALIKSFEDLDHDLLKTQPDVQDGCGAAIGLLVGDIIFTAVLGQCNAVLCKREVHGRSENFKCIPLGGTQRDIASNEERTRLRGVGVSVIGDGLMARVRHPSGALSPVGRTLGDPSWKGAPAIISCTPEVRSNSLQGHETHPFLLLASSTVANVFNEQLLVDIGSEFLQKPRAICGEIAENVKQVVPGANPETQFSSVGLCWLPPLKEEAPAAKKQKTVAVAKGLASIRLRHILVRFVPDSPSQVRQIDGKGMPVTRTRAEAEIVLRKAIRELDQDLRKQLKTPKDAQDKIVMESKKFVELCREISDCPTAKKGGAMCGDLGWLSPELMQKMGFNFKENAELLVPGQWSDITQSKEGLHFIQKVA